MTGRSQGRRGEGRGGKGEERRERRRIKRVRQRAMRAARSWMMGREREPGRPVRWKTHTWARRKGIGVGSER
jgi:hypothetical protein